MKAQEIEQIYADIEALHNIKLSNITIKAYVNKKYEFDGWIFPGGYIERDLHKAMKLAKQLNKAIPNDNTYPI